MNIEESLPSADVLHYEERSLLPDEARTVVNATVSQDYPGLRLFVRTAIADMVIPITKVAAHQFIRAVERNPELTRVLARIEFDGDGHYTTLEGAS